MIDTLSLKKMIIDNATSGILSSYQSGDGKVDSIISELPKPSAKRKKLLEQAFEYDEKYTIPEHWRWVRLGEISTYGDSPKKVMPSNMHDNMWILELEDIEAGGRLLGKKRFPERMPAGEKTEFTKGQILYSKLRPYLKKVLIADEEGASTPELIAFDVFGGINAKYITYCLVSSYVDRIINKRSYGVKMPRVDSGFMANLPIPLPSLEEQERIVNIVEKSFEQIDNINDLQAKYSNDIAVLKSKIIDAGIQGKLTEQLPEDGNAEDLYVQILNQKSQLIKEGKIKKEKPLPDIAADEIPFEIPKNWKWIRLGDVASIYGGKRIPAGRSLTTEDTGHKYIRVSDMKNGTVITDNLLFVPEDIYPSISRYIINKEDVYITVAGTIGKVGKIPAEIDGVNLTENADRIVFEGLSQNWLIRCLSAAVVQKQIESLTTQVAQPKLAIKRIQEFIIPLPPYAEQDRIATKIDAVLEQLN